ncbi:Sec8 exocyst complex component specific domain protein [Ostertagia ostertagi]
MQFKTGLLINVIRSLTTSVSEDQRELEKSRLQKGFQESEALIDKLVKSHQQDVEECLDSFRDVSTRISACRERIHNVRNALHTCKTHLECRRDDLKKLWLENSQQKYICEIMAQLEELKEAPLKIDMLMNQGNYTDAAKLTSTSRDLLNGRLAKIEGLCQLRTMIRETSERLSDKIVDQIVEYRYFLQMFDLVQSMSEQRVMESEQCSRLHDKLRNGSSNIDDYWIWLGGGSVDMDRVMSLSRAQIDKQVAASVSLMRVRASIDENLAGDQTHLTQLVQMIVCQLESSRTAHKVLEKICAESPSSTKIMKLYWGGCSECRRDRFAALWLLVLTDYNKNVTDMYERTTKSLSEIDGVASRRKISAAWAADEDISSGAHLSNKITLFVFQDILQRNERESEILIGNLATQKKIERAELLTDMSDVRALAALHESLRWFACEVRRLINSLPQHVKTNLRGCMVQVRYKDGQITDNVIELGRDLQSFHQLLSSILSQPKLRYIFDGLGHLCAAIFIHSSQHMPRLSESGKKRVCRNIWGVQQRLSQITSRREAELDRARAFFELLAHEPDRLLAQLPDRRSQFTPVEMGHLVALSVRSHPTLSSQHGALEQRLAQLSSLLKQPV